MTRRLLDASIAVLVWWLEGLQLGLPARFRDRWFRRRDKLVVHLEGETTNVELRPEDGSIAATATIRGDSNAAVDLRAAFGSQDDADVVAVLPRGKALLTTLRLPVAAQSALRRVLYHELDRLTPFAVEDLVFDFRVTKRNADSLIVDVAIARRADVQSGLRHLDALGLRASAITIAGDGGQLLDVNLLPPPPRYRLPFTAPRLKPAMAAVTLGALIVTLYAPLARYDRLLEEYKDETAAMLEKAMAAESALAEQKMSLEHTRYLASRQMGYAPPIELLLELTERLPDHTWLTRLSISASEVMLHGESHAASELLSIVEGMDRLEDARFQAPVARSNDSGKEQFSIVARAARNSTRDPQ